MNNSLKYIKNGDILETIEESNIWIETKTAGRCERYLMNKGEKWKVIGVKRKGEYPIEFDIQSLSSPSIIAKRFSALGEDRFIIINHIPSSLSQLNRFKAVKEKLKKIYK